MKNIKAPIVFGFSMLIIDQGSKLVVKKLIPLGQVISTKFGFEIFNISPPNILEEKSLYSILLLILIPVILNVLLIMALLKNHLYNRLEKFMLCGIVSGFTGNIIDNIFHHNKLFSFIVFKIISNIPMFNIASFTIVICSIIMLLSFIINDRRFLDYEQKD